MAVSSLASEVKEKLCELDALERATCSFCGQELQPCVFSGRTAQDVLKDHERCCAHNPDNPSFGLVARCQFCQREMTMCPVTGQSAEEMCRRHQQNCRQNPDVICPYCNEVIESCPFTGASAVAECEEHQRTCSRNPSINCIFCGLTTKACPSKNLSAEEVCRRHLPNCSKNPAVTCRFCKRTMTQVQQFHQTAEQVCKMHELHCEKNTAMTCKLRRKIHWLRSRRRHCPRMYVEYLNSAEKSPSSAGTYTMYHGTSEISASSIEENGFYPSDTGMLGPGIYLSTELQKARAYGKVVFKCEVDVGRVIRIDRQGHPMQKSWQSAGYDAAWVPPACGMVASGLPENCIARPEQIRIVGRA